MIVIDNRDYSSITDFEIVNESQFLAKTEYGLTYFDITMSFDDKKFEKSEDAIYFIISKIVS